MSTQQKKYISVVKNEFEGFENGKQMERKTGDVLEHAKSCIQSGKSYAAGGQTCCSNTILLRCTSKFPNGKCRVSNYFCA
jgi:hypothetical protein